MTTPKTIAGLMGPTLLAIGIAMLLNISAFPVLAEQIARDAALILVSGILLFVAGLAIVRVHNRWQAAVAHHALVARRQCGCCHPVTG